MSPRGTIALAVVLLLVVGCASSPGRGAVAISVPRAMFSIVHDGRPISFDELAADAARADVVFFGEQHDDPEAHFAEFALLDAIGRVRPQVVVSLEMFERDVQPALDDYLAGRVSEADFLAKSRPWDRYATDYRALVLMARARGWRVVAANVPRPIASAVSRRGLAALDTLPDASRSWAARDLSCPHDTYFTRFAAEMKGHEGPATAGDSAAMRLAVDRFYDAQCVKDETMAESIARAHISRPDAVVVHVTGAFHTDLGLGTAERVRRRLPSAKTLLITAIPVAVPSAATPTRPTSGDYVIFTRKEPGKQ